MHSSDLAESTLDSLQAGSSIPAKTALFAFQLRKELKFA